MIVRHLFKDLLKWKSSSTRKPLILRGARQVGKSFLIRELGKKYQHFIELNFEERPDLRTCFDDELTPQSIIRKLELLLNISIDPVHSLLFFDEIQACPKAITALRYFHEKLPALHIIAAGSLLDFELEKTGVPVGRIQFLFLYPVSFEEFLAALSENQLLAELESIALGRRVLDVAHKRLLELLKYYLLVGGLPEAVASYAAERNMAVVKEIQSQLVTSYRQDFLKYAKQRQIEHIELVFSSVPRLLGNKFKYSEVSRDLKAVQLSAALNLLAKARVVHKVTHSSSNGVPLGAEENPRDFKCFFLDIGLCLRLLGTSPNEIIAAPTVELINKGSLAEQFVAQEFLANRGASEDSSLHYWRRESASGNAEVDFVLPLADRILPIEVKAGASGRLRSLSQFAKEKPQHTKAVRIYSGPYLEEAHLLHVPLYAVGTWLRASLACSG